MRCKVWACSKQGYTQFRPTAYPPTTRTRQINHPNKAERPDWRPGGHGFCALIRPFCLPPTPPRNTVFRSIWLPVLPPPTPPPSPFPHSPRGARWLLLRCPVFCTVTQYSLRSFRYPNWAPSKPSSPLARCCRFSRSRRRPRPTMPTRMGKLGTRSPRRCRASIAASALGQCLPKTKGTKGICPVRLPSAVY